MRKLLFLVVVIGLSSCEPDDNGIQEGVLVENTTVSDGDHVLIRDPENSESLFSVEVVDIQDSRCPGNPNVQCITGGFASVDFETSGYNFALRVGETKEFSCNGASFRLTLVEVLPIPMLENRDEVKSAIFFVERV
jgi:hypothetical protein